MNHDMDVEKTDSILNEVLTERMKQREKWGQQDLPIHNPDVGYCGEDYLLTCARELYRSAEQKKYLTYKDIVFEEYCEVWAARTIEEQRAEAVQLAACVVQMIERIDRMMEGKQ